jgi:streptogramin lyase
MAPRLAAQIPAAAEILQHYVAAVDAGRVWLDGVMRGAIGQLRALTGAA